jgi:hypothetical protein
MRMPCIRFCCLYNLPSCNAAGPFHQCTIAGLLILSTIPASTLPRVEAAAESDGGAIGSLIPLSASYAGSVESSEFQQRVLLSVFGNAPDAGGGAIRRLIPLLASWEVSVVKRVFLQRVLLSVFGNAPVRHVTFFDPYPLRYTVAARGQLQPPQE